MPGALPEPAALELQYRGLGATDIGSKAVSTAVGDGYVTTYTLRMQALEVHGRAIALAVGDRTVAITVSASSAARAKQLSGGVLGSLRSTD
ncbi:MAG: hypothetical protein R2734_00855 [Nocardioides sp.]